MAHATVKGQRHLVRVTRDLTDNWSLEVYPAPAPGQEKVSEPFKNWPVPLCLKLHADSREDALSFGLEHMKKLGKKDRRLPAGAPRAPRPARGPGARRAAEEGRRQGGRRVKRLLLGALCLACACGPPSTTVNLKADDGTLRGVAGLTELVNPADNRVRQVAVQLSLFGTLAPGSRYEARIHQGTCAVIGTEAFRLEDVLPSTGDGATEAGTLIDSPLEPLRGGHHVIAVVEAGAPARKHACGGIP
jgi:hypothetical protein